MFYYHPPRFRDTLVSCRRDNDGGLRACPGSFRCLCHSSGRNTLRAAAYVCCQLSTIRPGHSPPPPPPAFHEQPASNSTSIHLVGPKTGVGANADTLPHLPAPILQSNRIRHQWLVVSPDTARVPPIPGIETALGCLGLLLDVYRRRGDLEHSSTPPR